VYTNSVYTDSVYTNSVCTDSVHRLCASDAPAYLDQTRPIAI